MITAIQKPQDLTDLLTERGLHMILQPMPGAQPVSKKHDLNVLIMDRFWLLQYAKPATDLEVALFNQLKEMDEDYGDKQAYDELEEELTKANKKLDTSENLVAELREQIAELETRLLGELV